MRAWLVSCLVVVGALASCAVARADVLTLDEVLDSVLLHHPLVQAGQAGVDEADAQARAARGEFDPVLSAQGRITPMGYYDWRRLDTTIEQPTPWLGTSLYTGYRVTRGKVPSYYGEYRTREAGEVRGGVRLPVLQGRAIDSRRAGVARTRALARASERGFARSLLDMEREAAQAYFAWVAAGRKVIVLLDLLQLAEDRDAQIRQQVDLGALPSIEQLDNRRTILERTRQVVTARRALEKASYDLSLYLRDPAGEPRAPSQDRLPPEMPLPPSIDIAELPAFERALLGRPELSQAEANIEAARIERELAQNGVLPRLDAFGEVSRDLGAANEDPDPSLVPTAVEFGVSLSVPLLQRSARGRRDAANARLDAAQQRGAFARDRVIVDVQDALSQLRAAEERAEVTREGAEVSRKVADGENERFELGASTVLFVNLREQAAADAQIHLIDALQEVSVARVRLTTAMGERLVPEGAR